MLLLFVLKFLKIFSPLSNLKLLSVGVIVTAPLLAHTVSWVRIKVGTGVIARFFSTLKP